MAKIVHGLHKDLSVNKHDIAQFRASIINHYTYGKLIEVLKNKYTLTYSISHLTKILNGRSRPSYALAVALMTISNSLIKASIKAEIKLTGKARKHTLYTLRTMPFGHYKQTAGEYFESTPRRKDFIRYSTGSLKVSMAALAHYMGVSERTLQHFVRGSRAMTPLFAKTSSLPYNISTYMGSLTNKEVIQHIVSSSKNASN